MLPNEEFALACRAKYEAQGLVVDSSNGEFAHSPLTRHECDTGYYLLHSDHQHQGLLQSRDLGKCCFLVGHAKKWLMELDYFPENYFELWSIYEEYSSMLGREVGKKWGKKGGKKIHEERNEEGKSVVAVKNGKKGGKIGGKKAHEQKDENGKSIQGLKNAKKLHEERDENGKSANAVKGGKKAAEKTHAEKDENGKSVAGVKGSKTTNSQVWESTIDGFRSNSGGVACHNKARGWDPAARIRIS